MSTERMDFIENPAVLTHFSLFDEMEMWSYFLNGKWMNNINRITFRLRFWVLIIIFVLFSDRCSQQFSQFAKRSLVGAQVDFFRKGLVLIMLQYFDNMSSLNVFVYLEAKRRVFGICQRVQSKRGLYFHFCFDFVLYFCTFPAFL